MTVEGMQGITPFSSCGAPRKWAAVMRPRTWGLGQRAQRGRDRGQLQSEAESTKSRGWSAVGAPSPQVQRVVRNSTNCSARPTLKGQ